MKWPWVSRALYEQVLAVSAQFLADKKIAEDRLYAAWKDGNTIPPREAVTPRIPQTLELLPSKIQDEINNWESPEVRADLDREARRLLFDLKFPEDRVIELWKMRQGDGQTAETTT
jgi:hypothetical protein